MIFDLLRVALGRPVVEQANAEARVAAEAAADRAERAASLTVSVEARLERLNLLLIAALELLRDRAGVGEAEILAKVEEIDRRDGRADGRLRAPPRPCPSCARPNHALRLGCIYCGARMPLPMD